MILGLATPLTYRTPEEWARKHKALGCKAVVFPVDCTATESEIEAFHKAAMQESLVIAEVGIWKNVLSADKYEREQALEYSINQLRMADRIGALCCVNIVGTPHGPVWDGAYAGNYSPETWDMIVKSIQHIIDEAKPKNTKFAIEPMPWMVPSSPDEYLKLIQAVDREAFGVHMDLVNMINCPQRYLFADAFKEECFEKLHGKIISCHLKDILLLKPFTVQLQECACGEGMLNLERYAELASWENPQIPMIIEHLESDDAYLQSLQYVKNRLSDYIDRKGDER